MANLTSIAQRLNDVEINNNAPVSSQTNRRIGSSINYLLDLLNITDGTSGGSSGALGDLALPAQTLSFSVSITPGFSGTPVTLFNFTGSSTRHLSWVQENGSNFSIDQVPVLTQPYRGLPGRLLRMLQRSGAGGTYPGGNWKITVAGVDAAILTNNGGGFQFSEVITLDSAPSGTHTVALVCTGSGGIVTTSNFSATFKKLFI